MKLYKRLAEMVAARLNCEESGNYEWFERWTWRIEALVKEHMPSGSGFNSGTTLDLEHSTGEKLLFVTSFQCSDHTIRVHSSLLHSFVLTISGYDRNQTKDYIHDAFRTALIRDVE